MRARTGARSGKHDGRTGALPLPHPFDFPPSFVQAWAGRFGATGKCRVPLLLRDIRERSPGRRKSARAFQLVGITKRALGQTTQSAYWHSVIFWDVAERCHVPVSEHDDGSFQASLFSRCIARCNLEKPTNLHRHEDTHHGHLVHPAEFRTFC